MMRKILSTLLLSAVSLVANASIVVDNAFVRAVPPGQQNTAVFMTLHNTADKPATLIAASSSIATVAELHTHTEQSGVMQMRQIKQIALNAASKTELKPGGLHIMLLGLNKTLLDGDSIDLTLKYADGSEQQLTVPVQPVVTPEQHQHHHH